MTLPLLASNDWFGALIKAYGKAALAAIDGATRNTDAIAIEAMAGQGTRGDRIAALAHWITLYKVHRVAWSGEESSFSAHMAQVAIDTFANQPRGDLQRDFNHLVSSLNMAYQKENSGDDRSFLSLSSKLLWLRYPKEAPIFDSQAHRSVLILRRVHDAHMGDARIPATRSENRHESKANADIRRYGSFVQDYLEIYGRCQSAVEGFASQEGYPYPIRVFDKVLWLLGKAET